MRPEEISKKTEQLVTIKTEDLAPLPFPYDTYEETPITPLKEEQKKKWEHSLDGVSALDTTETRDSRRGGASGQGVSKRFGKIDDQGKQLDLSSASNVVLGILRKMSDLRGCVPGV